MPLDQDVRSGGGEANVGIATSAAAEGGDLHPQAHEGDAWSHPQDAVLAPLPDLPARAGSICGMRVTAFLLVVGVITAGCGAESKVDEPATDNGTLSAHGISIDLPERWSGRILLGADGRPVLHAADFALPSNDTDVGQVARESLGENYVNVRNVGRGAMGMDLPVRFERVDFDRAGSVLVEAAKAVSVSNERFVVTAVIRSNASEPEVARLNRMLATLRLAPYVAASPPDAAEGERLEGYGVSMRLPAGWTGSVTRGHVEAASAERGIRMRLVEHGGTDASFVTSRFPLRLSATEFVGPGGGSDPTTAAGSGRSFVINGREFVLWSEAGSLPPRSEIVMEANSALATLRVQAGDFYPGVVAPAVFAPAAGWHTGTNGPAESEPEGQQTWTYASTVPYRDEPLQAPPYKTLEVLPPDGIVIWLYLFGPGEVDTSRRSPPFRLTEADRSAEWQGQVRDLPVYSLAGRVPGQRYGVNISVYFGRSRPTRAQLAAADAELARLELPDWTSAD